MSRNVFILGAGASREVGAPLMRDFLDVASDLARMGMVQISKEDFDLVAQARSALQSTHSKSTAIDLYNMEAVFSAFEMGKMLGGIGGFDKNNLEKLPFAYRKVISETLENTINFKVRNKRVHPGVYQKFIELIKLIDEFTKGSSSILTFNYDVAVDYACSFNGVQIDYGLDDTVNANYLKLLKLHGSLNWTECTRCKKIVAWPLHDYLSKYTWQHLEEDSRATLGVSKNLSNFAHCGLAHHPSYPFIVPPTWNKSEHHHAIESVWQHAAKELSEAENIFIIGYSLPDTDTFFHYLFSLGTCSEQVIRRFWVIDPNPEVEMKYRNILGNAVLSRFRFFQNGFSSGIDKIENEFKF